MDKKELILRKAELISGDPQDGILTEKDIAHFTKKVPALREREAFILRMPSLFTDILCVKDNESWSILEEQGDLNTQSWHCPDNGEGMEMTVSQILDGYPLRGNRSEQALAELTAVHINLTREGMEAESYAAPKNNGVTRYGIHVGRDGCAVSPVIYPDAAMKALSAGGSLEAAAAAVVKDAEEAMRGYGELLGDSIDGNRLLWDFPENVSLHLVNYEANRELLETRPHTRFLNLAATYHIPVLDGGPFGDASIPVTNEFLSHLARPVTVEEIHAAAMDNLKKESPFMQPLRIVIQNAMEMAGEKPEMPEEPEGVPPMTVLTDLMKNFGARFLLRADILKAEAEKYRDDIVILPSSIHELILVPARQCWEPEELGEMVSEVNIQQVEQTEILAWHPYIYRRATRKTEIYE